MTVTDLLIILVVVPIVMCLSMAMTLLTFGVLAFLFGEK